MDLFWQTAVASLIRLAKGTHDGLWRPEHKWEATTAGSHGPEAGQAQLCTVLPAWGLGSRCHVLYLE